MNTANTGSATGINFALDHGGSVAGRVFEAGSLTPIANARVYAQTANALVGVGTSDEAGRYRIDGLATASYRLHADHSSHQSQVHAGMDCVNDCATFGGEPVGVENDETDIIDFQLQPHSYIEVETTVTGQPQGTTYSGAQFRVYYPNGAWLPTVQVEAIAPGRYRLGPLDPGHYVVLAQLSVFSFSTLYPSVICESDCDAEFR